MKNFIKNRVLPFIATSSLFVGGSLAYINYKTSANYKQYLETLQAGALKDASRLTNDSFGISWGFQADDIVMKQIDSGDYIFMKYDYRQCLNVTSFLKCFYDSMLRLEEQFDSIGYAFRNEENLYVLFNEFGVSRVVLYTELVGLPFIRELMIQKNTAKDISVHRKLKKFFETQNGEITKQNFEQSSIQLANRVNTSLMPEGQKSDIRDLKELLETEKQIHVRTETNRTLRSL